VNELIQMVGANQTAGFILVLARISPLFVLAPIFSSRMIPTRAKGVAAVALAIGMAPVAMRGAPGRVPTDAFALAELAVKELLIGLAFAFAVAVVFQAMSIAGSFLDTLVGFSFGSLVDPITGTQSPVLSQIYSLVGVMVFIAIGGDGWMIRGLAETYDLVPLLAFPSIGALVGGANAAFVNIFFSAIQIAAPVLIAVTITDAAFGIVSRVSPQMNVFAVGMPAKIIVAILLLGASLPFVAGYIDDSLRSGIGDSLNSIRTR
jgi:flagellar biosynthesis protein FliR